MRVGLALCGDVRTLGDARFTAVNRIRKEWGACHPASGGVEDPPGCCRQGGGRQGIREVESSTRDARSVDRGDDGSWWWREVALSVATLVLYVYGTRYLKSRVEQKKGEDDGRRQARTSAGVLSRTG